MYSVAIFFKIVIMQIHGIDLDKNAIQRIESGERFVTDIELKALAKIFDISIDSLLASADTQANK